MEPLSLEKLPEVFVSNAAVALLVTREMKRGHLRKLASRLYTKNKTESAEKLVSRHLWTLVAAFFPGALIADRTAIENVPTKDGSIFLVAKEKRSIKLPGITIKPRKGVGPLESDKPFIQGLFLSSPARAFLENSRQSRARQGVARTLSKEELEERLETYLQRNGEFALNQLREEMRQIAPQLGLEAEFKNINGLIGTLLGTQKHTLSSTRAKARANKLPYDSARIDLFQQFAQYLSTIAPQIRPGKDVGLENLAFFEAYFSNFIEGTEFEVAEAHQIVFEGKMPQDRPADAHDVIGTYRLVSNLKEMQTIPQTAEELIALLCKRHQSIMEGRPDKRPGKFKMVNNRAGLTIFVAPELVRGTLYKGFEIYQTLQEPFHKAIYMMFFIAEVHPFADGNGRLARVMMNAELVAASEMRLIIPIIYRSNYLVALKTLSQTGRGAPLQRTLDFAQKYTGAIDWSNYERARIQLEQTHAFFNSQVADLEGIRLVLP